MKKEKKLIISYIIGLIVSYLSFFFILITGDRGLSETFTPFTFAETLHYLISNENDIILKLFLVALFPAYFIYAFILNEKN